MNTYLFLDNHNTLNGNNAIRKLDQLNADNSNGKDLFVALYINYIQFGGYLLKENSTQTFASKALELYDAWKKGSLLVKNVRKQNADYLSIVTPFYLQEKIYVNKSNPKNKDSYLQFLDNNQNVFLQIDLWINNRKTHKIAKWSETVQKNKLSEVFDLLERDEIDQHLIQFLDQVYLHSGLYLIEHFEWPTMESNIDDAYQEYIESTQLFHPKIQCTTEQKQAYQNSIQYYIKKQLKELKQLWNINTPFILFDTLNQKIANEIASKKTEFHQIKLETNPKYDLENFPNKIFEDYKAYVLFDYLVKEIPTIPAISCFYRIMNEIENPPLIVVKDTPFRKWFNEQNYKIQLNSATNPYFRAVNKERELIYYLVKKLINSNL